LAILIYNLAWQEGVRGSAWTARNSGRGSR
jgi:hypothetical protein